MTRSLPALPMIVSSPSPPLIVRLTWPALSAGGVDGVVAGEPVDDERVVPAPSAPAIVTLRRQSVDQHRRRRCWRR